MKNIKVELVTLPPELVLVNAIKKPYLNESANIETVTKVVNVLKHESVAEHIWLNFNISGISRLCLQELARHRMTEFNVENLFTSLTVQSTRYTLSKMLKENIDSSNVDNYFVVPLYDETQWNSVEEYNDYITTLRHLWVESVSVMKLCRNSINLSSDYLKYFVPEALRVELAWSINVRSLRNFLKLRKNKSAHFEIRYLAELIQRCLNGTYLEKLVDFE